MKKCPRCKTWNKEPGLCVSCGHDLQTPFVERVPIYKRKWFFILCGYLAIVLVVAAYRQLRPTPPPAYTPPPTYMPAE